MSLKSFHLVFVTVCTLLFAFVALWGLVFSPEHSGIMTFLGGVGVAGIPLMVGYGIYFYRKIKTTEALADGNP